MRKSILDIVKSDNTVVRLHQWVTSLNIRKLIRYAFFFFLLTYFVDLQVFIKLSCIVAI